MSLNPRAVVVYRPTEYSELLGRHGTRQQIQFFLERRGHGLDQLDERHRLQADALATVAAAIPTEWRRAQVKRGDLDRWLFEPEDVVIAVGQDGLVPNVAKYLSGQPVVGVNPDPARNPGLLVRISPNDLAAVLHALGEGSATIEDRAMVQARTDDGQSLLALNEVFIGHSTHQSARYSLALSDGRHESQSSSGILVGTGTGATGWCRSVWNDRRPSWQLPEATSGTLAWFVREAWPSPSTGVELTAGRLEAGEQLRVVASSDALVIFGDGIEADRLELTWGQEAVISVGVERLRLVTGISR